MEEIVNQLIVVGKGDNHLTKTGLPLELQPFGEVVAPKKVRGKALQLTIKGLQQFDISNRHGAILCANGKRLKVYCGKGLQEEAEIEFEQEIKCLKINDFDDTFVAIGFGNRIEIIYLVSFIQSKLQMKEIYQEFNTKEAFNQIIWHKDSNNIMVLRDTESKQTAYITVDENTFEETSLGETDAVCLDLEGSVCYTRGQTFYKVEAGLFEYPDEVLLNELKLTTVYYLEEFEKDLWFFVGFIQPYEDDEDLEVHLVVSKKDAGSFQNNKSSIPVDGSISEVFKYKNFLEYKIIKVATNTFCLFQSVTQNSQAFKLDQTGTQIEDIVELKIQNIKGEVRGAAPATFKIDEDHEYLQLTKSNKNYYQFIPRSIMTYDSLLTISKYYYCNHMTLSEESKQHPQDPSIRTVLLDNQIKFEDNVKPVKPKVEEEVVEVQKDNKLNIKEESLFSQNKQQPLFPNLNESLSQNKQQQLFPNLNQNMSQNNLFNSSNSLFNPSNSLFQPTQLLVNQKPQIEEPQKIKVQEPQQIKVEEPLQMEIEEPQKIGVEEEQEEEYLIKPDQIEYNKQRVNELLTNFKSYQSKVSKLIYSNQRYAYDYDGSKESKDHYQKQLKYTTLQTNFLTDRFHELFVQSSIHSADYIFEKDKLLFCAQELDGNSYIYAMSFVEYENVHKLICTAEKEFNTLRNNRNTKQKDKNLFVQNQQKLLEDEMNKYKIFCSATPIIQIHVIYSYFISIVFKNGIIMKDLNSLLSTAGQNQQVYAPKQNVSISIKQIIFSKSKKYFLIQTTDNMIQIMNTMTHDLYYQASNVLFANFGHDNDNQVYILDENSTVVYDFIKNQKISTFNKFSTMEYFQIIHFEEYKPGNFYSVQSTGKQLYEGCDSCKSQGCKECRQDKLTVFQSKDLTSIKQIEIDINHQWSDNKIGINQNCYVKCHYNPQIKQLVSIFNQMGSLQILNIQENHDVEDPGFKAPQWVINKIFVTGFIYFPYRQSDEKEVFNFMNSQKIKKSTYLLPSILVFTGMFHLTRISLYDSENSVTIEDEEDNDLKNLPLVKKNTLITIKEYTKLINNKIDSFIKYPDYYLLYEKMEELKHILEFLEENKMDSIIQAQFSEDLTQLERNKTIANQVAKEMRSEKELEKERQEQEAEIFESIKQRTEDIFKGILQRLQDKIDSSNRLIITPVAQTQISNLLMFNKDDIKGKPSLNLVVEHNSEVIFAVNEFLYLHNKQRKNTIRLTNNLKKSNVTFSKFVQLSKISEENADFIALVQINNETTNLVQIHLHQAESQFSVTKMVQIDIPNQIHHFTAQQTKFNKFILITYSNSTIDLFIINKKTNLVDVKRFKGDFAMFSLSCTVLVATSTNLSEYIPVEFELSETKLVQRSSPQPDSLKVLNNNFSKIAYMFQHNPHIIIAVGVVQNQFTTFPITYSNLSPLLTAKDKLDYSIKSNINISTIQFKGVISEINKQFYLTSNQSNKLFIYPLSINTLVHKPCIKEVEFETIQELNIFYLVEESKKSTTLELFDLKAKQGVTLTIAKNVNSYYYVLDE